MIVAVAKNGRARGVLVHRRCVVLAATISVPELAAVLRLPTRAVEELVDAGGLPTWAAGVGHRRVGWRSARGLLVEQAGEDGERVSFGLDRLHELRAGLARLKPGSEPPALEPVEQPLSQAVDRYRDEQLLEFVSAAAHQLGGRVSKVRFTGWAAAPLGLSAHELCVRFGRPWEGVLALSGSQPQAAASSPAEPLDRLALLREAAATLGGGERLSTRAFDFWAANEGIAVTAAVIIGAFGTWNAAKQAAGLAVRQHRRRRDVSDEQLLAWLREAADELGDASICIAAFDDWCRAKELPVRAGLAVDRFGSWNQAKRQAGLVVRRAGYQAHSGPADRKADR